MEPLNTKVRGNLMETSCRSDSLIYFWEYLFDCSNMSHSVIISLVSLLVHVLMLS